MTEETMTEFERGVRAGCKMALWAVNEAAKRNRFRLKPASDEELDDLTEDVVAHTLKEEAGK